MKLVDLFPHPIVLGPMAAIGANSPALVAGVCNAGGLGSLGAAYMTPAMQREQALKIRELTDKPFAINLFIQATPEPSAAEIERGVALLQPVWSSFGWDTLPLPARWCEDFEEQFAVLLEMRPAVASFALNILSEQQVETLHAAGILVAGTATTLAEAQAWQAVGADVVVASGIESGGHRATFLVPQPEATQSVWELGPEVCASLRIPVVLAGGFMNGADIAAALKIGAQAVQMGTAFLVTDESAINPAYKKRLIDAAALGSKTRLTRSFSGRYARGLENRFMEIMAAVEAEVPAYPVQNALTGITRLTAGKAGDTELMSLWAGMQVQRARPMPVAQLMATLLQELQQASV